MEMRSKRGIGGEAAVLSALVKQGLDVLIPFGEGQPYDLAVDVESKFVRVQCKTAWRQGGCLIFNSLSTDHGRGAGSYVGRADVFGVYFPPTDSVYIVPVGHMGTEGRLRLEPCRNNQRKRIRLAQDYAVEGWSPDRLLAV
jgi:hypothetical protein